MQVRSYHFFLTLVFYCSVSAIFAQNVKIKGKAHASHVGKPIDLFAYSDLITYTQTKEVSDTIDKDGYFELDLHIDYTQPVILKIGNLSGKLYIQPDFVYGITFPERDSSLDIRGEAEAPVQIGVLSADSTELNSLIIDFNNVYNKVFSVANYQFLNRNRIFQKIDTLALICSWRYKTKNQYFRSYVDYSIADLNANASRGKNFLSTNYIYHKPIQHKHFEYMTFFNSYFKGYLNAFTSTKSGENVYHLINTLADYKGLAAFLKTDQLLGSNDTLRELVTIRNLWDYYYSPQFNREAVVSVIEQFWQTTLIYENKKIADNILKVVYQLQVGAAAPVFSAANKAGKTVSLTDFKGRYVYLNFFSTKNISSLKEMPKILDLVKKYGDKMAFVSICTDDSIKTYKDYIKANPKYTWPILFNNSEPKGKTAKDLYNLKGLPAFFFINHYGNLAQSPALAPTQGFEFKLRAIFKPKKSNIKTGIR